MKIVPILEKNKEEYLKEANSFKLYGQGIEGYSEEELKIVIGWLVKCLASEQIRFREHSKNCNPFKKE